MANLTKAKVRLAYEQPFFASILCRRPIKENNEITETMAVDKTGNIYYNKKFIESISDNELVFVLCHEIMHVVCLHALRQKGKDQMLWNVAGDLYINSFLETSGVHGRPENCLFVAGSEEKTTEQIYRELLEKRQQKGKGSGQKGDDGNGDKGEDMYGDDNIGQDLVDSGSANTQAEIAEIEAEIKLDVASACNEAKNRGRVSGSLARMIDALLNVKTPWYELLEKFFVGKASQKLSWARPNRRFTSSDVYLPTTDHELSLGTIVVGIDTSGSIGQRELNGFSSHLNAILEQCNPEKVIVLYCDSSVARVDEYTHDEFPVRLKPYGGGGTDMTQVINWINENEVYPDLCCILTDGYTPFADSSEFPTVWAITTGHITSPYGETVNIDWEE